MAQAESYTIDAETGVLNIHHEGEANASPANGLNDQKALQQWSIRLLTYQSRAAAEALVRNLRKKGFKAEIIVKTSAFYLVRITGLHSYDQAVRYRQKLLNRTNIEARHIHIELGRSLQKMEEVITAALDEPGLAPAVKPAAKASRSRETDKKNEHMDVAAEPEMIILHVTLNTEEAGTHYMMKNGGGDLQVTKGLLKKIGLKTMPLDHTDDSAVLSLKSMAPWLTYELDTESGELALMADPSLLPVHNHSLQLRQPSDAAFIQNNALFLNYDLGYRKSFAAAGLISVPFELGMNLAGVSIVNNFSYQQHQPVRRTQSLLVYDDRDNLLRWMAGDISASSGSGIGGATIGGISLSKNYGLRPDLFTAPPLQMGTMLTTPSEVEVLINGQSIYKADFPAGKLNLANIPYYRSGSSNAALIVRDAFGREKIYSQALYTSNSLLAPGLSQYNYSLGMEQQSTASSKLRYGKKALLFASHRYGLTDWLTPGFGIETDGNKVRGGIIASLLLGNYGQLDVVTAASHRAGLRGGLVHMNYNYTGTGMFSPNLFITTQSPGYGGILDPLTTAAGSRWNAGAGLAVALSSWGSITGRWTKQLSFNHQRLQSGSLLLSGHLPASLSFTAQLTRTWTATQMPDNQTNISLSRYFNNGIFLTANYSRSNRTNTFGIQIQFSPPLGEGFGYSASLTSQPNGDPAVNTRLQYRNQYGKFSAGRTGTAKAASYDVQLSSALLLAGGSLHVSRPIRDSFALVRVNGIDHIKVSVHNQEVGETDNSGELVVPYLSSYSDNRVSINPSVIPLGYKIESTSKNVTSTYRGGGVVEFNVVKMQTVEGTAYYRRNGKLEPAQYSGIEIEEGQVKRSTIIGHGSLLYLENIRAGTYPARLFNQHTDCRFNLVIPESNNIINNIGDVICEMHDTGSAQ